MIDTSLDSGCFLPSVDQRSYCFQNGHVAACMPFMTEAATPCCCYFFQWFCSLFCLPSALLRHVWTALRLLSSLKAERLFVVCRYDFCPAWMWLRKNLKQKTTTSPPNLLSAVAWRCPWMCCASVLIANKRRPSKHTSSCWGKASWVLESRESSWTWNNLAQTLVEQKKRQSWRWGGQQQQKRGKASMCSYGGIWCGRAWF